MKDMYIKNLFTLEFEYTTIFFEFRIKVHTFKYIKKIKEMSLIQNGTSFPSKIMNNCLDFCRS